MRSGAGRDRFLECADLSALLKAVIELNVCGDKNVKQEVKTTCEV